MNIGEKAKEELEKRMEKVEDFIAERGLGSSYLQRAKKVQRNINLGIVIGGALAVAGITALILRNRNKDEE